MRRVLLTVLAIAFFSGIGDALAPAYSCTSVLSSSQDDAFPFFFNPKYTPSLNWLGGDVSKTNMVKRLTAADSKRLEVKTPVVVAQTTLNSAQAQRLRGWLNDNAGATVPGWTSTAVGLIVPQAWVGVAADVLMQLVNGSGDTGRLKLANLAGTVSAGGVVAVTEQVLPDKAGARKFVWSFLYQAKLNDKLVTTPLSVCVADTVNATNQDDR